MGGAEGTSSTAQRLMSVMSPMFHSAQQSHKGLCQGYRTSLICKKDQKVLGTSENAASDPRGAKNQSFFLWDSEGKGLSCVWDSPVLRLQREEAAPKPPPNPSVPARTTLEVKLQRVRAGNIVGCLWEQHNRGTAQE